MRWPFAKYVGCGNDFILFDNRKGDISLNRPLIQKMCHRHYGIGADGIILVERSSKADFKMRIFNSDGSEAEMCGNGLRCLIKFVQTIVDYQPSYGIETMHSLLRASVLGNTVTIEMKAPTAIEWNIPLPFEQTTYFIHHLNTGVPHAVLFMEDITLVDLQMLGAYIRTHARFAPQGTNVTIAQMISNQLIKIRTYERGVEAETLACGTGATAVALAAAYLYNLTSPLSIETASKEHLSIAFERRQEHFSNITLAGPAECTFEGAVSLPISCASFQLIGTN